MTGMILEPRTALILAGHGSHRNPHADESIFRHGDRIRRSGIFHEVREAFWKEEPEFFRVLPTLESERAIVVPLFMSNGYFVQEVLPGEFGITADRNRNGRTPVHLTQPVGTHPDLSGLIISRACAMLDRRVPAREHGLALVGHGTSRNPDSKRSIQEQAQRVRARRMFGEVRTLFLDDRPGIERLPEMFSLKDVLVIPLFMADGHHTLHDIPAQLGLSGGDKTQGLLRGELGAHRLRYTGALGKDPRLVRLIFQRVWEVVDPAQSSGLQPFLRHAVSGLMPGIFPGESDGSRSLDPPNDPGRLLRELSATPGKSGDKKPILARLLREARRGIRFDALSVAASGDHFTLEIPGHKKTGLTPESLQKIGAKHFEYISDWHYWTQGSLREDSPRWHFLRWLEYAGTLSVPARYGLGDSGHLRAWGELLITTFIAPDGTRRHEIRHRKDLFRDEEEMATYTRPADARHLAKYDAEGAYRPLRYSPSLRSGWRFSALTGAQVCQVIENFYPTTIDDWYRERTHRTEVTHFRDRVARQSGMYARLAALDSAQLTAAVEETCCDRHCLKRRLWQESESQAIPLSCGEGILPCPAPCSVVLEAARRRLDHPGPNGKRGSHKARISPGHEATTHSEKAKEQK